MSDSLTPSAGPLAMRFALHIDPRDSVPIWKQIEDGVRRLVASGSLTPGSAIPSVRDLARDLRVNPATVSKAYQGLVDDGILAVKRGEGTFVADTPPALGIEERRGILEDGALRLATMALTIGASPDEARHALERIWARLTRNKNQGVS